MSEKRTVACLVLAVAALAASCVAPAEEDRLARDIERLLREARALVRSGGCARSQDCSSAPVGAKPCGGPRTHWVYCRLTTDERALLAKLEELERLERALNAISGAGSDCAIVSPPAVEARGGVCEAR